MRIVERSIGLYKARGCGSDDDGAVDVRRQFEVTERVNKLVRRGVIMRPSYVCLYYVALSQPSTDTAHGYT